MATEQTPGLKTTQNSFELIDTIHEMGGATMRELIGATGMAKSTVYKHLKTLERNNYLTKEGNEYNIGYKFLNLGTYVRTRKAEFNIAKWKVKELAQKTGEETAFAIEEGGRLIVIHESYHERHNRRDRREGSYYLMHNTASGKAILAELSEHRVETVLDTWGLPETTDNTISTTERLLKELKTTRERGFAITDGELHEGLRTIASVVKAPDSSIIGALSVSGPTYRMNEDTLHEVAAVLETTVREFEEEIRETRS
jgi:DNA-binding IclR family transcriptional regulator